MPRFYLIDPWLADARGHNYQYALDVVTAAQERGFQPVLAVRQTLSADVRFPADWRIERLFEYGDCVRHWLGPDGRNPFPCDLNGRWLPDAGASWLRTLFDIPAARDRQRRIADWSAGCARLFAADRPTADDILFMPSMSEFDLLGAARFWRDHAWTRNLTWHLQVHFNLFVGRDAEFATQGDRLAKFQKQFRAALDQVPDHRVLFYATTEAIGRQFDQLGVGHFQPLPYPVRSFALAERHERDPSNPLRVTFAGAMRREKGKKRIQELIRAAWPALLKPRRVQFVFQASPKNIARWIPSELRRAIQIPPAGSVDPAAPILAAPHPLDAAGYSRFIRESDIGLFAYDARRYFARASGVLCEMLSAGVPVIVPANCWLAEQIAEPAAAGRVGIVVDDDSQFANCLERMVDHFEAYRRSAQTFARDWSQRHSPSRTVELLADRLEHSRSQAA